MSTLNGSIRGSGLNSRHIVQQQAFAIRLLRRKWSKKNLTNVPNFIYRRERERVCNFCYQKNYITQTCEIKLSHRKNRIHTIIRIIILCIEDLNWFLSSFSSWQQVLCIYNFHSLFTLVNSLEWVAHRSCFFFYYKEKAHSFSISSLVVR